MAFALDPHRPLGAALQAAALDEIDRALERLHGEPGAEDIHDARKSGKKLRAWLRLLKPELGERYALINGLLRDGARRLSAQRDADVAAQTLLRLRRGRRLTAAQFNALERALAALRPPAVDADAVQAARRLFKAARVYLAEFAPALSLATLRARVDASHRSCARGLHGARSHRPEDLHDWRKRVKYYGYQCALVAPVLPEAAAPIAALKSLGEVLGLHHDFHAFAARLEQCPPQQLPALLKLRARQLAQLRMDALAAQAIRAGETVFKPQPRRTSRR